MSDGKALSFLSIIIAAIALALTIYSYKQSTIPTSHEPSVTTAKVSAHDRIKQTASIRCSYLLWPYFLEKDSNTGELKGLVIDYMEAISTFTGLKYEWIIESSPTSFVQDLDSGKADVLCGDVSASGGGMLHLMVSFTVPLFYSYIDLYSTPDKAAKFVTPVDLQQKDMRISVTEGSAIATLMPTLFPNAELKTVSLNAGTSQAMLDVLSGKSDAVIMDSLTVSKFLQNNPDSLQMVRFGKPLGVSATNMAVSRNEPQLLASLNSIITSMKETGVMQTLINKNGLQDQVFLNPSP